MSAPASFTLRIILALILMVGFYIVSIGISLGLFLFSFANIVLDGRVHVELEVFFAILGCLILWSVFPRIDWFVAPGPRLKESDQPELFQQLRSVAVETKQAMPTWHPADAGTVRTVINLTQNGSSIISKPFEWYLILFLWITQNVSRHQEYTADKLAAEVVGPEAIRSALKTIYASAKVFDRYWEQEYSPVLCRGFHNPYGIPTRGKIDRFRANGGGKGHSSFSGG